MDENCLYSAELSSGSTCYWFRSEMFFKEKQHEHKVKHMKRETKEQQVKTHEQK